MAAWTVPFLVVCGGGQLAVAAVLTWRRRLSPVRTALAVLTAVNGAAALALTTQVDGTGTAFVAIDAATALPLLFLAFAMALESGWAVPWSRGAKWLGLTCGLGAALAAVAVLLRPRASPYVPYEVLGTLPVYLGYALILPAGILAVARSSDPTQARLRALVTAAFAFRIGEFCWTYTLQDLRLMDSFSVRGYTLLDSTLRALMLASTSASLAALAWLAWSRAPLRGPLTTIGVVVAAGLANAAVLPNVYTASYALGFVASVFSLYAIRPALLGIALEPARMKMIGGLAAVPAAAYATTSLLVGAVLGPASKGLSGTVIPASIAAVTCAASWPVLIPHLRKRPTTPPIVLPPPKGPTQVEALATFLLACYDQSRGARRVTKEEILAATGIKGNNLAKEVRRLTRNLQTSSPSVLAGGWIRERRVGVRGRMTYSVAPEAADAMRVHLTEAGTRDAAK